MTMIAVVADDFSGAAEIAGIGFSHGLASEIHTESVPSYQADLVALDTDSRSCPAMVSAQRVAHAVAGFQQHRPPKGDCPLFWAKPWIFKKVDSVLRGPVLAEVRSVLAATGKRRAILVPANPSRGRVIRGGRYFVDGRPIHQSPFAADPEHPATSSDVLALLGRQGSPVAPERDSPIFVASCHKNWDSPCPDVAVLRPGQQLPHSGIIVGEASTPAEVMRWTEVVDDSTLPAGAADYFAALLAARGHCPSPPPHYKTSEISKISEVCGETGTLFVCGSAAAWAQARRDECARHGVPVIPMPQAKARNWSPSANAALAALDRAGRAMLTIADEPGILAAPPLTALSRLVDMVAELLGTGKVGRVFVEGGRTASALVRRMGWTRASVCRQYAPGVVAMRFSAAPKAIITVKPGSYPWPDQVWRPIALHD
jgi:uncharacterized protein YgbK (DUF1537 family)